MKTSQPKMCVGTCWYNVYCVTVDISASVDKTALHDLHMSTKPVSF